MDGSLEQMLAEIAKALGLFAPWLLEDPVYFYMDLFRDVEVWSTILGVLIIKAFRCQHFLSILGSLGWVCGPMGPSGFRLGS